ncbi:MAG: heavy-metal-associated domain-containing protein [Ignavibacteria bacterium]
MTEIKFKTNINCNHCISKITPVLDSDNGINEWNVDLNSEDKILTIKGENPEAEKIITALSEVGYFAEKV